MVLHRVLLIAVIFSMACVIGNTSAIDSSVSNQTVDNSNQECEQRADIFFVLDSSGSLAYNFQQVKDFVINIIQHFDISSNGFRVGLITYSDHASVQFYLRDYNTTADVVSAINNMTPSNQTTNTAHALATLNSMGFAPLHGDRPDAPNIAIVVTDGRSNDPAQTKSEALRLKGNGVSMFAVGVTGQIYMDELQDIASSPVDRFAWTLDNFNALSTIQDVVAARACEEANVTGIPHPTDGTDSPPENTTEPCEATVADVVFIVDSSSSLVSEDHEKTRSFIRALVDRFNVAPGFTRVGVLVYSNTNDLQFHLSQHETNQELAQAVDNIRFSTGGTMTMEALRFMHQEMFKVENGARAAAPDIAIVITDGQSHDPFYTAYAANEARNHGVTLFAIGVGHEIDMDELRNIANDPNEQFLFRVDNYEALVSVESMLARTTCNVGINETVAITTDEPLSTRVGCFDVSDQCRHTPDVCTNDSSWGHDNCQAFCGYCEVPSTTEPPCVDIRDNCAGFGIGTCSVASYREYMEENCRAFCGFCGDPTPMPSTTPTPEPSTTTEGVCEDKLDCTSFGWPTILCTATFGAWARANCMETCGLCVRYKEVQPSPPMAGPDGDYRCPSWTIPEECNLVSTDGCACPVPSCPPGSQYRHVIRRP